ncbi:MAG: hypothetical protein ACK5Z2_02170 [Bacteroidota bacterium]
MINKKKRKARSLMNSVMSLKKSGDIATFCTEIAEVSLTNSLLYIRLLDGDPDLNELERHRRKLKAMLPARGYHSLIDLQYAESGICDKIELLLPHAKSNSKIAVLTKEVIQIPNRANIMLFRNLRGAREWLKST